MPPTVTEKSIDEQVTNTTLIVILFKRHHGEILWSIYRNPFVAKGTNNEKLFEARTGGCLLVVLLNRPNS